jgi:acyl-CoA thioester hydrolase
VSSDETGREFVTDVHVRWRDLDVLGHVYQGRYQEWLEEARGDVFAEVAGPLGYPFVIANINLNFRHEVVKADGTVRIRSRVRAVGSKSVTLAHFFETAAGTHVADGESTLVAWDRDARCSRLISDQERGILGA